MPHSYVIDSIKDVGRLPRGRGDELWVELIKARQKEIILQVGEMGKMKLGNVPHYDFEKGIIGGVLCDGLSPSGLIKPMGDEISLSTRGVFIFDQETHKVQDRGNNRHASMLIWGFSRNDEHWIAAEVILECAKDTPSGDIEKRVKLRPTTPYLLRHTFGLTFPHIFGQLGEVIRRFAERRQELATSSAEWWHTTQAMNELLRVSEY